MRMFVAINLPEDTKARLAALVVRLRASGAKTAWTRPENMHLTLRFLGEVPDETRDAMILRLETVCADFGPVHLHVTGIGAFPNLRKPAVLWAGVAVESGDLAGLQEAIERAARECGVPPETHPFRPHLTLARIREGCDISGLRQCVESLAPVFDAGAFTADRVALCSSRLAPTGAVHTVVREFSLA